MNPLGAFAGYGVELEYMIVDRKSMAVRPMADELLRDAAGAVVNELPRGRLGWSNELTLHVIELKNEAPVADLAALAAAFQDEVREIDRRLEPHGARLMPTGMHPWMDPARECRLWPHGHADIYRAYDRIFDCQRLGFANIQSVHLNLPFADDGEFARLHAAVRLLLPLLPALAASSPIAWGGPTGFLDTRLEAYISHQARVPETLGLVVPDTTLGMDDYRQRVLAPMYRAIDTRDPAGILRHEWLNARGAIPRFERMALEIRLLDMQEYPGADLAVAAAVAAAVQRLYRAGEDPAVLRAQQAYPTKQLAEMLRAAARDADQLPLGDPDYLALLDLPLAPMAAREAWQQLIEAWWREAPGQKPAWERPLKVILEQGPLARRILRAVGLECPPALQETVYWSLCDCLDRGTPFEW